MAPAPTLDCFQRFLNLDLIVHGSQCTPDMFLFDLLVYCIPVCEIIQLANKLLTTMNLLDVV